jgi:hypothetical protein
MRRVLRICAVGLLVGSAGCLPDVWQTEDGLLGAVSGSAAGGLSTSATASVVSDSAAGRTLSGSVRGSGNYQLFELGPAGAGWRFSVWFQPRIGGPRYFTVVLFDSDYDLLMRAVVSESSPLRHVMRLSTSEVVVGIMPSAGSSGGDFTLYVESEPDTYVPPPRRQVVYLNFAGAEAARVHRRPAVRLGPFDAAVLGPAYEGFTEQIRQAIVEAVRTDYAAFDVVVLSSDDGPPPQDGPYATVYFGGNDENLLGLADSVDMYNEDPGQAAIVYVEAFADYQVLGLSPDQMGLMIGNVASHELGHLLGLYHTADPGELMDTTGSAWDLAQDQCFRRAPLEQTVFPVGNENAPRLLLQTVGPNPHPPAEKTLDAAKLVERARMRAFVESQMRSRCGLCLNPDE